MATELTISIVSWNTKDLLEKCLRSLKAFVRPEHTRIVVVDNASSDGTPEMIKAQFPEVTLINSGANLGFGRAHNLVAAESNDHFVLFLNPDAYFTTPAHERMLQVFRLHQEVGAVGCRMEDEDGHVHSLGFQGSLSPFTQAFKQVLLAAPVMRLMRRTLPLHDPDTSGFLRMLYGGCLMVRRQVLDQIGWFDERFFMYAEDADLSRRIRDAGYQLYYLSDAKVIHTGAGASSKVPGRFATLMQCESVSKLMQKYHGRFGRAVYVASVFSTALSRLFVLNFLLVIRAPFVDSHRLRLWRELRGKYSVMLMWSLGRSRARIPS